MNRSYSYPYKDLWEQNAWKGRSSRTNRLAEWIQTYQYENKVRFAEAERYDGPFDAKTLSITNPDTLAYWKSIGLNVKIREMGGVGWVSLMPAKMDLSRPNPVTFVLTWAEYTNPYWPMDLLARYDDYCRAAIETGSLVIFVVSQGFDVNYTYVRVIQESAAVFHFHYDRVYLDISDIYSAGAALEEVSGLPSDELSVSAALGALRVPVLDITALWPNRVSQILSTVDTPSAVADGFSLERLVNSRLGKRMAESMVLQHDFTDGCDPRLYAYWAERGVSYERHDLRGEPWITLAPADISDTAEQRLPLIIAMMEVTEENPQATLIALSYHYGLCELVETGEAIALMFALEDPDDNEILTEMIRDAIEHYPIDPERIYICGHSHNGNYSLYFAQRHPELITAVATFGNMHGLVPTLGDDDAMHLSEKKLETFLKYEMPLININGELENDMRYDRGRQGLYENWARRLRFFGCRIPTPEEFLAASDSGNRAERKLGITADTYNIEYHDGYECYTGDVKNLSGDYHLRFVTIEAMLHLNVPIMADISWQFLRRFRRDAATHQIVEL